MPLIFNAPYKPDLNGIEYVQARAKKIYRADVYRCKALNIGWDYLGMVENSINNVTVEQVIACANRGAKNVRNAVAIQPISTE